MNPFEMVIGIVLIVTIGSIVRAKYGARRDRHGNEFFVGNAADNAETKALQLSLIHISSCRTESAVHRHRLPREGR